jgi:putative transposase
MPRPARVVAVGAPHHITHRGNNRQDVFLTDEDRRRYQHLLRLHLGPCQADLLGWCWMSNHVHLIVVPHADDSLARLIRRVHSSYAQDFNRRRSRDGHLWRSRFYSCPLGPSHLDAALLYVDLNPVRAAMTGTATAWEWSSARAHVSGHDQSGLLSAGGLAEFGGCADWEQRLRRGQTATAERALRLATRTGAPFADAAFREEIERQRKPAADRRTRPVVETVRARAAADQTR